MRVVRAVAVLRGEPGVSGIATFEQAAEGAPTRIQIEVHGLAPGKHGVHIHEFGDITNGLTSTGAHYNPHGHQHAGPQDAARHAGDLGNIEAPSGDVARLDITDKQVQLIGPLSVVGRALVVHADEDDLGRGGVELSLTTGNSGARLTGGVIGIAQ
ncbi:superoxide dismutase family protein [Streptomyces sp. NPDC026206]|uniref:superoxide dismutase family protein n=1 Tax=Streptomyces sp. NPDC026206 TaxID=3157089 RepID=UPI0033EEEC99